MNTIYFVGTVNTQYGRGKDKQKRRSRVGLISGATLGGLSSLRSGRTLSGTVGSALIGAGTGYLVDKGIDKEKKRYKAEGARSWMGKIVTDTKIGAKSVGATAGIIGATGGGIIGALMPGSVSQKLVRGGAGAVLGGGGFGVSGALTGASIGAQVGIARGLLQPNRKKPKDRVVKK